MDGEPPYVDAFPSDDFGRDPHRPSGRRSNVRKVDFRQENASPPPRTLPTISAADFAGKPIPPRAWHVEGMLPAGTVSLLYGDGGTGKSLLAAQLAVATVTGGTWIGREVRQGACLFITAEDDLDELHRRLADIAADLFLPIEDLTGLTLSSLVGEDAVLGSFDPASGIVKATPLFEAVRKLVQSSSPALVVLDTLADLFAGDENHRTQARQFIGLLRSLAVQAGPAVLLLGHPSLSGMASGTGTSGSTGWNNSVRSRLYFERVKGDDGREADPDARVLKLLKANYGQTGSEIRVRWRDGVFVTIDVAGSSFSALAAQARADRIFLDLLDAYKAEGRHVSPSPSATWAPTVFTQDPRAEGLGKKALQDAMNRLFAAKAIQTVLYGPPSKQAGRIERC